MSLPTIEDLKREAEDIPPDSPLARVRTVLEDYLTEELKQAARIGQTTYKCRFTNLVHNTKKACTEKGVEYKPTPWRTLIPVVLNQLTAKGFKAEIEREVPFDRTKDNILIAWS